MVITNSKMSQSKVSVNTLKKTLSSGMSLITNLFNFFRLGGERGWSGGGRLFE